MGSPTPQTTEPDASIVLDGVHRSGKRVKARLNARIIGPKELEAVQKQEGTQAAADPRDQEPQSQGATVEETKAWASLEGEVIEPPYSLGYLSRLTEKSTELGQNIRAMVTNVVGFGWRVKERPIPDDIRQQFSSEIEAEKFALMAQLSAIHPVDSFSAVREKEIFDKYALGNGYLELIENSKRELVGIDHIQGHTIRLVPKDKKATKIQVPRVRPDKKFMVEDVPMFYRFRRLVQVMASGKITWFKEAGDPRLMDKRSGKYVEDERLPPRYRATSLIHNKLYSPNSAYGLPVHSGGLFSIEGSRASEEINFSTLQSNAIPSMMVIVENGMLTEKSIERLEEWTSEQIQKARNYSKFLLLEGEVLEEGSTNPGSFKIRVEPLKRLQQQDELFQNYDANNRDKVRQMYRLPPIFVGRADDYTRATADTSRDIADEQVFAPERTHSDYLTNRHVLSRWGARFHEINSNHPNITDDIELIRLMAIAERSGAMTPRRADRIIRDVFGDGIGPMPTGIELDRPFSLQFAEAQKGTASLSSSPGMDAAQSMVDNLIDLREKIEKELDSRLLLDEV